MTTRAMNEAVYFCTADADQPEFYHYGLAASMYTHFTSPIRRYADVLVHRLLASAIDIESLPANMSNKLRMTKVCDKMNFRNRNARFAGRASSDYHTYLFFKGKTLQESAIVSGITRQGVTVLLPRYGLEGQITFSPEDAKANDVLAAQNDSPILLEFVINGQKLKLFDYLTVKVTVGMKNFHKQINLEYVCPGQAPKE